MTYKHYYTRLKHDTVTADKYVQGVIFGMMLCICKVGGPGSKKINWKESGIIGTDKKTGDRIYNTITTHERYHDFMDAVEKFYPGACEFDIFE